MASRKALALGVVATIIAVAGAWWLRSGAGEALAEQGVRAIAVGRWSCTQTYGDDYESKVDVGIRDDGRFGYGREGGPLPEMGTWELDGLRLTVELSLQFQGVSMAGRVIYTGDADPPTRLDVIDELSDDTGRFRVEVEPRRVTFTQGPAERPGLDVTIRHSCEKVSDANPDLV